MSYPKRLLRLQPTRGINVDTAAAEVRPEYWTGGKNVNFRDGYATRILGSRDIYTTELATISPSNFQHALNAQLAAANYWLTYQQSGQVHATQPGVSTRIDNNLTSSIDKPSEISSALINGIPIINNGKDEPVYWPGTGNLVKLPDWTATETAKFVAVLKFHVFAMNISGPSGVFGNLVKWSSATEPGTVPASWTPAPGNQAGSVELADSEGDIICAYPLGDSLYIYKRSAVYQVRYVGGNSIFSVRKLEAALGAITPRAVCDIGGRHFVVKDGDIVLFDGSTIRSIGEGRVRDFLFNQLGSNYDSLFCTYNRARDEVLLGYPVNGQTFCNQALVYDISRDSFGMRDLPGVRHAPIGFVNDTAPGNTWAARTETWADAQGTWASSLTSGARDSLVYCKDAALEQQDLSVPVNVEASISRYGLTFDEPERVKFVRRLHLRTRENYGDLSIRLGSQMTANSPISWSQEITATSPQQLVNVIAQGRYISIEMRSSASTVWKITGVELEAELRGYY